MLKEQKSFDLILKHPIGPQIDAQIGALHAHTFILVKCVKSGLI